MDHLGYRVEQVTTGSLKRLLLIDHPRMIDGTRKLPIMTHGP